MSKPIMLTEEVIQQMTMEFAERVRSSKLSDGKINYTKSFSYEGDDDGVTVLFTPAAYAKMLMLLHSFDSEVAWHGVVERAADDCFIIKDILVYPQVVTGATVNTDQEEYQQWCLAIDDDTFNAMHMQGHSHVNMGTTPSATDLTHQESILSQIDKDGFYIFMIWNKRLERNIKIYDMKTNTLYENSDVAVGITGEGEDLEGFIAEAKTLVQKKAYSAASQAGAKGSAYGGYGGYGGGYGGAYGGYGYYGGPADDRSKFASAAASNASAAAEKPAAKGSGKGSAKSAAKGSSKTAKGSQAAKGKPLHDLHCIQGGQEITDYDDYVFGGKK